MQLISVNTGLPREVEWHRRRVLTSIWKNPVDGPVAVDRLNLAGDRQADLSVHGGSDKAVYVYPSEHYEFWARELPGMPLPWGAFGENFTTTGLLETSVNIGDRLTVGSASFVVTQPRMPCFKLAIRFADNGMVKRFLDSRRTGFYLAVRQGGVVAAGQAIDLSHRDTRRVSVHDVNSLYADDKADPELLRRALQLPSLPGSWKDFLQKQG